MEATEEASRATHVGAYRLVRRLFQGVEGGNSLEEGILSSRAISLEDAAPQLEPVAFICGVLKKYGQDLVRD